MEQTAASQARMTEAADRTAETAPDATETAETAATTAGVAREADAKVAQGDARQPDMAPDAVGESSRSAASTESTFGRWTRRALFALAIGFGAGLSPKAPGTVGTLIGIPLAIALSAAHPIAQGCLILGFIWLAVRAAAVAEARFGTSDDGRVVSDEIAGYLVAMAFLPPEPMNLAAAFVLFRLFDILKPWPCSHFDQKRHDAVGNVMDDVCAGLYARALLQVWIAIWP